MLGTGNASSDPYGAEIQQSDDSLLLTPASPTRLTGPSDDPWSYHPSFANENGNVLGGETTQNVERSPRNSTGLLPGSTGLQAIKPSSKEALDSSGFRWNHTFAESGSFKQQKPEKKLAGKPGCRRGPLQPDKKKHASDVRQVNACYLCRFKKQQVSSKEKKSLAHI